jgi:hypothetical protein
MTPELIAILGRLERLEKENRRFRRTGLVLLLVSACVFLASAAQSGRRTLTANEFVLVDHEGHARAKLAIESKRVALTFLDQEGRKQMSLSGLRDDLGREHASLALGEEAATNPIALGGTNGDEFAIISDGGLTLAGTGKTSIVLGIAGPNSPVVEINDSQGYATILGASSVQYASGKSEKSSNAILLLGKDRKVIWSAP